MSQVVASLIAKIGADTKGFETKAMGVKGSLLQLATNTAFLTAAIAALEKGFEQTVGVAQEYDQSIKGIMDSTGGSADQISRLVQVLDDAGIELGTVQKALKEMAKDGTEPTIEQLAKLSDEFLMLGDGAERGQFLLDKFGKSGMDMARAMSLGGDALLAMNENMDGGLILTEENIRASEEYRKNLDELNDSVEGVKVSIGNSLIPTLTDVVENINLNIAAQNNLDEALIQTNGNYRAANSLAYTMAQDQQAVADATTGVSLSFRELESGIRDTTMSMEEQEEQAKSLTETYNTLISGMMDMQAQTDSWNEAQAEANAEMQQANADLAAGNITQAEHDAIIAESTARLNENSEAHRRWAAETVFAFAQARAAADGNISKGEGEILIAVGQQLGLFDAQTVTAMQNVNAAFDTLDASDAQATIDTVQKAMDELARTYTITIVTDTSGVVIPDVSDTTQTIPSQDSGGMGVAGQPYLIGAGAQPELFIPNTAGQFIPNADKLSKGITLVNYGNIYTESMAGASLMEQFG